MKKTTFFNLIVCLLILGCSKVDSDSAAKPDSNQLKTSPNNGTVSYFWTGGYYAEVVCEGAVVEYLGGDVTWHIRDHYKDGEIEWSIYNATGSLTGELTGEVFEIHESDKVYVSDYTFHCNLVGDQGSHYILNGTGLLVPPWTVTIDKAICLSN